MKYLCFLAVLLGVSRFYIPAHPVSLLGSYEAVAHLFIGGLIGAAAATVNHSRRWEYIGLIVSLSLVEIVAFLYGIDPLWFTK
jgi:hypothetical protein